MKTATYTRVLRCESDIDFPVNAVRITVDEGDYRRWMKLLALGRQEPELAYVQLWDYRCEFFKQDEDDVDNETVDPSSHEEIDVNLFQQETSRVEIMVAQQAIKFIGYQKHSGSESRWSTYAIKLSDIATDLGIEEAVAA